MKVIPVFLDLYLGVPMVNSVVVYKNVNHSPPWYYHLIPLLYYGTTRVLLFKAILLTILYLYLTIDSSNL